MRSLKRRRAAPSVILRATIGGALVMIRDGLGDKRPLKQRLLRYRDRVLHRQSKNGGT
jgi:hypothetical protein